MIKNNKPFIIVFTILIVIIIINYFIGISNLSQKEIEAISSYSFWQYSLIYTLGTLNMVLAPLYIAIAAILPFFRKLKEGFIQYEILRKPYKKYILKELGKVYLKALLLFPLISILLVIFGTIFFGSSLGHGNSYINNFSNSQPFIYFLLTTISMSIYSIFCVNITLILMRYINKFFLLLIALFLTIFFYGYFEANFIYAFIRTITNNYFNFRSTIFDSFFNSLSTPNWFETCGIGLVRVIFTSIILFFIYRNKERLVLNNEE